MARSSIQTGEGGSTPTPALALALRRIAEGTLQFLYSTKKPKDGYGSDKWLRRQVYNQCMNNTSDLWQLANDACRQEYCCTLDAKLPNLNILDLATAYENVRKGNWKKLKNGDTEEVLPQQKLFKEPRPSVIYAYISNHEDAPCRVIKIGFTTKKYEHYIMRDNKHRVPTILGFKFGTKTEEQQIHTQLSEHIAAADEFYFPANAVIRWIRDNLKVVRDFESIIQREFPGIKP